MLKFKLTSIIYFGLALFTVLFCSGVFLFVDQISAEDSVAAQTPDQEAYLELSVEPAQTRAGGLITLNISYHNIGLPYTTISIDQPDLVEFDPPLSMPCKFHEHPNGCQAITFRTLAPGEVQFNASANGEIWSEQCQCWFFTTVTDNGPAKAKITEPLRFFILLVMK
jgi:hypothetical protein